MNYTLPGFRGHRGVRLAAFTVLLGALPLVSACGGPSVSAYCNQAKQAATDFSGFDALSSGTPTLSQTKAVMQKAATSIDNLDDAAPSAISTDTHKLRVALDKINSQVQSAKSLQEVFNALISGVTSDLQKSADKIDTYTKNNCGFSLSSPSPSP